MGKKHASQYANFGWLRLDTSKLQISRTSSFPHQRALLSKGQKDIRTKIPYGTIKIPMPTMKPISWERNSRKELLYFPEIRTIILPYCRMIVLLKTEANANKMSLFFPSTVLSLNNPDNIGNFVQELTKHFMTDKTIQVGAKHDFNIRKVTRLQKHLT